MVARHGWSLDDDCKGVQGGVRGWSRSMAIPRRDVVQRGNFVPVGIAVAVMPCWAWGCKSVAWGCSCYVSLSIVYPALPAGDGLVAHPHPVGQVLLGKVLFLAIALQALAEIGFHFGRASFPWLYFSIEYALLPIPGSGNSLSEGGRAEGTPQAETEGPASADTPAVDVTPGPPLRTAPFTRSPPPAGEARLGSRAPRGSALRPAAAVNGHPPPPA